MSEGFTKPLFLTAVVWALIGRGEADAFLRRLVVNRRFGSADLKADHASWRVFFCEFADLLDLARRPRLAGISRTLRHKHFLMFVPRAVDPESRICRFDA